MINENAKRLVALRTREDKMCPICSTTFQALKIQKFCSNACKQRNKREKEVMEMRPISSRPEIFYRVFVKEGSAVDNSTTVEVFTSSGEKVFSAAACLSKFETPTCAKDVEKLVNSMLRTLEKPNNEW